MDWGKVLDDMIAAAKAAAGGDWPKLSTYAQHEFQTLAGVAAQIEAKKQAGAISEMDAEFIAGQYKAAAQGVVYAISGLAKIVIQNAWNAAMDVLRKALNSATGWALI
ncbi:hypothetical protein DF153_18575 [Burkholderia cenocepacia]|uniref:hypothetical protein n=1 Tax=Burkholderia vietnamiensis TaxID=60552 RepID=UPI000F58689F|nr:hypothetical protein [Burkholderia vietnamiensis]RQU12387.1 hypothetical protein DF152_20040 [Burkholderia cenocepacia]RQU23068.1 hypothetical protein DF153_18575 [Burkholderia cenocepacia]